MVHEGFKIDVLGRFDYNSLFYFKPFYVFQLSLSRRLSSF